MYEWLNDSLFPLLKCTLALSYSERKTGSPTLSWHNCSVTHLNLKHLQPAGFPWVGRGQQPTWTGCLVLSAVSSEEQVLLEVQGVELEVQWPPVSPICFWVAESNCLKGIWFLGSVCRDVARPQECAHYRELDDCPECDSSGGAGVLPLWHCSS